MKVIFCDNHLLVVSKPANMTTQPHFGLAESVTEQAKSWIKKKYHKPANVFLEPVHRLDKPVSGLVLFARTSKALSRLQEMVRKRQMEKIYFAWVEGVLPDEGVLEHFLIHDDYKAKVVSHHPKAKIARLQYVVVQRRENATLVRIELHTGRYHQIRAQFSSIGHPVLGDTKYGSREHARDGAIALHHGRLLLTHPVTHERLTFEQDWCDLEFGQNSRQCKEKRRIFWEKTQVSSDVISTNAADLVEKPTFTYTMLERGAKI